CVASGKRRGCCLPMHSVKKPDVLFGVDPGDWPGLERLLDAALDLPPEQRETWMASLGPEHANLLPALRDMLSRAPQVQANSFLATLPPIELHTSPASRAGELV